MSQNIHQVFVANPITSNASTDLMYFGQSPYGAGNDAAMTYANFSAQFGAPYTAAALTRTNDTNVTLTLGGTPSTALLQATSITVGWSGQLAVSRGGTGLASATAYALIAGGTTSTGNFQSLSTGSTGQILQSQGNASLPAYTTATYPATTTINQLLYSSSANTVAGLTVTNNAALTGNATGVPTWIALTDGQIIIGSSAGAPLAATLSAGSGISITNGHNTISVASNGAQPWVDQTTGSVTMAVNTGYTSDDGASLVTFTLPTTSAIGDWVEINGKGSGLWTIAQASGQQIHFGSSATTLGATGTLSSTNQYDCVKLRCITANTIWVVVAVQGNLTVV